MRYNKNNNRNNLWQHHTTLIGHGNKILLLKPSDNETFPEIWEYNAAFLQSGGLSRLYRWDLELSHRAVPDYQWRWRVMYA